MSEVGTAPSPASALLATKFLPPLPGRGYLRRDRLHRRMEHASSTPITLLSAPAGFGKTSLLAGWLAELESPWAWLSIDHQDNDPERLWAHLITAVQRLAGELNDAAMVALRRQGGRGPVERWLTPLINDLAATTGPVSYLVVDDLHLLTDRDQRAAIGQLASCLPAWLHLVISTRADPPLPLPRLRADGQITEFREVDLRFDSTEVSSLLAASIESELDDGEIALLAARTEGWAAGLRLATITLADRAGDARIDEIVGSLRLFTDYLITEVVDQQPAQMRAFLYATAVVDRINPSLATALSGEPQAGRLLREAEQQGLFLVALDGRGEWYRYHHLFAEALRHELTVRDAPAAAAVHAAAARWFETNGQAAVALEHWLAAGQPEEALRLAVDVGFALVDRGQAVTIESIARRIPTSVPGADPAKQLAYGILHLVFEPETFLAWVGQATASMEQLAEPSPELVTQYVTVRAMAELSTGAWDAALEHATTAVARGRAPGGATSYSTRAELQVIRAAGWLERLDDAERAFRAYIDDPGRPHALRVMVAPAAWALAAAIGGRIDEAEQWAERSAAAGHQGFNSMFSTQDLLLTQAIVARERADGEEAVAAVESLRAMEIQPNFALQAAALIELALVRLDEGRLDVAADQLDAARRVRAGGTLGPLVISRVDAVQSRLCLADGDVLGACRAAERMPDGLWKEVAIARTQLAGADLVAAAVTLERLSPSTPRQHVTVEMLRALAVADQDAEAARSHAMTAATVAAAAGLHQTLLGTGPGAMGLIDAVSWAVPRPWLERTRRAVSKSATGPRKGNIDHLVEQPTDRERDAARFLPSRLTVREIAHELGVSPNTLKTHLKSLYRKLDVSSREEAVDVARKYGILR